VIIDNLGSLGSGSLATVTIVVQPVVAGTITNNAIVGSAVTDPFKGNNRAAVKAIVELVQLGLGRSGNNLVFSWPANASGYVLESTPSLAPPVTWTPVTNPTPQVVGGQNVVQVGISSGTQFYRLRAPAP